MMIAVLSGKGGAGKTFVSVNLAASASKATYIDCDVEEPDGRLFLNPKEISEVQVFVPFPSFDKNICSGCRKCVEFCHFNALAFIKDKPIIFKDICHSCGGCIRICPEHAVTESKRQVGTIEIGTSDLVRVVTGILQTGEASAVPVIRKILERESGKEELQIVDCPPGSGCSVMESVRKSDYCVLVAEPTAFGFYNFKMIYELVRLLNKKCGVVINKMDAEYAPLENYCDETGIPVLLRIPYSNETAAATAGGNLIVKKSEVYAKKFQDLLEKIRKESI